MFTIYMLTLFADTWCHHRVSVIHCYNCNAILPFTHGGIIETRNSPALYLQEVLKCFRGVFNLLGTHTSNEKWKSLRFLFLVTYFRYFGDRAFFQITVSLTCVLVLCYVSRVNLDVKGYRKLAEMNITTWDIATVVFIKRLLMCC